MGDIVQLRSPIDLTSDLGRAFIVDATRAGEGLMTDRELQEKYEISDQDWRPGILDQIMTGAESAKHKIDAIRELRATATGGGDDHSAAAGEKFTIILNLGADCIERHEFDHTPKPKIDLEQDDDEQWR